MIATFNLTRFLPLRRRHAGPLAYYDLYRQRRALAAMGPDQLTDLGLTCHQAHIEAERPVWDAPDHWLR